MGDELTAAQITVLAADLRTLLSELTDLLATSADSCQIVELDQPIGRLSRMDAIQQQKMAKASRRNHERRLGQVTAALAAIESGDYGLCRRCEEPVDYARLRARPETPFCLSCQRRAERSR